MPKINVLGKTAIFFSVASVAVVFGIAIAGVTLVQRAFYKVSQNMPQQVACTEEAKQCPDGSYVGRTGPRCEFTACPTSTESSNKEEADKSSFQDAKVTVLSPNGGEVFRQGEEITIKWETKARSEIIHQGAGYMTSGLAVNLNLLKSGMVVSGLEVGAGSGAGVIGGGPSDSFRWGIPDFINGNVSSDGTQFKIRACLEYRKVVPYDCRYECPAPGYTIDVTLLGCDDSNAYFAIHYNGASLKFAPHNCPFDFPGFCSESIIWSKPLSTAGKLYLVRKDSGEFSLISAVKTGQQNFLLDVNQAVSLSKKFKAGWYYFELKLDNGEKYTSAQFYIFP